MNIPAYARPWSILFFLGTKTRDKLDCMTATELMTFEADSVGYQLDQVLNDLPQSLRETRLTPSSMSPDETLEHLCECYQAAIEEADGKSHDWGSFKLASAGWDERLATCRDLRGKALEALLHDDAQMLKACSSYITTHDVYHVGQLAALRISGDPSWDPYSIYKH